MYCDWPHLGRCCFCMPLRRGVLVFAYIHIFLSAFMIGLYSYSVNYAQETQWMIYGRPLYFPAAICLAFFCFELIFDGLLIYGAHTKKVTLLRAYYYYTMTTSVALLVMQLVDILRMREGYLGYMHKLMETTIFAVSGLCVQLYLLTLVWSLIKKLQVSGPHVFDNQLQQIVSGEVKEPNGVYHNPTVVPTDV